MSLIYLIYVGKNSPYRHRENNYYDMINELFIFNLTTTYLSFMNTGIDVWVRTYYNGWYFIGLWVISTMVNLGFIIHSTVFVNFRTTLGYLGMLKQMRDQEAMIRSDIEFKKKFLEENPVNFLVQFEVRNAEQFLLSR